MVKKLTYFCVDYEKSKVEIEKQHHVRKVVIVSEYPSI